MAGRGYRYQAPTQPATHHWPKQPTLAEIGTAAADVTCKAQVNLPNTVLTVQAAYQQALLSQNPAAFTHLQTAFGALLQRTENLLSALKARSFGKAISIGQRASSSAPAGNPGADVFVLGS
jgi:hypothetical protein